jgi:hypothetical protein
MTITKAIQSSQSAEELKLPWDLTEWIDLEVLLPWIHEEIDSLNWSNPELLAHLQAHPQYQPKTMLALLTYAYATGVFESEEILRRCYDDARFRSICAEGPPQTAHSIKKFRRDNRGLLKWSLFQLFKRTLKTKLGEFLLPAGLKRYLVENAVGRLDLARHMDRGAEGG